MGEMVTLLDEAAALIHGRRQEEYGHPRDNFQFIVDMWSAYLGEDLSVVDVVNMMIMLKISRTLNGYHRDSYVDIAGYAGCAERVYEEPEYVEEELED